MRTSSRARTVELLGMGVNPVSPVSTTATHTTMLLPTDQPSGVETRTNAYPVRTGNFPESPISVYFTVRQFWGKTPFKSFVESYQNQRRVLDELVSSYVVPNVITPLAKAIAAKQ